MSEISHFIAIPFDRTDHGLVAGEGFKCATPASAIAFVRTGYPDARTTVLRRFGTVPDNPQFE